MEEYISELIQISDHRFDRHVRVIEKKYLKLLVGFYSCLKPCFYHVGAAQSQVEDCVETCKAKGNRLDALFKKPLIHIIEKFNSCDQGCFSKSLQKDQKYHECLNRCRDNILPNIQSFSKSCSDLDLDVF